MSKSLLTDIGFGLWLGLTIYLLGTTQRTSIDWLIAAIALGAVVIYVVANTLRRRSASRSSAEADAKSTPVR